jgi:hypothetical protein
LEINNAGNQRNGKSATAGNPQQREIRNSGKSATAGNPQQREINDNGKSTTTVPLLTAWQNILAKHIKHMTIKKRVKRVNGTTCGSEITGSEITIQKHNPKQTRRSFIHE